MLCSSDGRYHGEVLLAGCGMAWRKGRKLGKKCGIGLTENWLDLDVGGGV